MNINKLITKLEKEGIKVTKTDLFIPGKVFCKYTCEHGDYNCVFYPQGFYDSTDAYEILTCSWATVKHKSESDESVGRFLITVGSVIKTMKGGV